MLYSCVVCHFLSSKALWEFQAQYSASHQEDCLEEKTWCYCFYSAVLLKDSSAYLHSAFLVNWVGEKGGHARKVVSWTHNVKSEQDLSSLVVTGSPLLFLMPSFLTLLSFAAPRFDFLCIKKAVCVCVGWFSVVSIYRHFTQHKE